MNLTCDPSAPLPLRVLFVEDSVVDCELLRHEMAAQGFAVEHARVESKAAMELALDQGGWELVLADYQLPGFSGVAALELLHERGLDLPFILVSGTMEDNAVVKAMRAGAHDYIEKRDLTRLGPAIERELREAGVRQELRRALHDVRDGAERLKLAASASNTGLWDWNLATDEMFFSAEWKAQLGYQDDELASTVAEWEHRLHPEDHDATLERVRAHVANPTMRYESEARLRHRDGTWRWIHSIGQALAGGDGRPTRMLGSHQDITEKKRFEADFLRAQRVQSIGTLAGGVAHDLNNLLAPILMGSELLRDEVHSPLGLGVLTRMEACALRGADLVRQLLTFARGSDGERVLLQPRHLLQEVSTLLPGLLTTACKIKTDIPRTLWTMEGDATQFHQVLLNLCINARDAMPNGGTLTLKASNVAIDATFVAMQPKARCGPHVCFEVTDTGVGIPADQLEKIFEPFFTTKTHGRGTGLGLATVQTIVRSHSGFVQVQSAVARGTTFKVFLPAQPEAGAVEPDAEDAFPTGCDELVLVVDDEAPVREMIRITLERHGYRVLTAIDGAEGLTLFLQNRGEVSLVVTDLKMPCLDGIALVRAIRRFEPHAPIMASSGIDLGEAAEGPHRELAALGVNAFLQKPYRAATLLRLVREVLGSRQIAGQPPAPALAASGRYR